MNRTLWEELVAYAMPPNKLVSGLASMWYVKRLLGEILGLRRGVCSTWATSTWLENAICFFDRNLCKFFPAAQYGAIFMKIDRLSQRRTRSIYAYGSSLIGMKTHLHFTAGTKNFFQVEKVIKVVLIKFFPDSLAFISVFVKYIIFKWIS